MIKFIWKILFGNTMEFIDYFTKNIGVYTAKSKKLQEWLEEYGVTKTFDDKIIHMVSCDYKKLADYDEFIRLFGINGLEFLCNTPAMSVKLNSEYFGGEENHYLIMIDSGYGLDDGLKEFSIFHEIGHIINGDFDRPQSKNIIKAMRNAENEIAADNFAFYFFNKNGINIPLNSILKFLSYDDSSKRSEEIANMFFKKCGFDKPFTLGLSTFITKLYNGCEKKRKHNIEKLFNVA